MIQESNCVEFKSVLNDKMEKEVVAFLNNQEGGILYIGLDDDGHPVGSIDLDSTQLKIADRIKNNILSPTLGLFDIVTEVVEGVSVIKILVSSGLEKPEHFIRVVFPFDKGSKNFDEPANEPINEPVNEPLKVSLSNSEKKVFEVIKNYQEDSKEQIAEKIGKSRETVTRAISGLVKKKKIYRVGSAKTGHWGVEKEDKEE